MHSHKLNGRGPLGQSGGMHAVSSWIFPGVPMRGRRGASWVHELLLAKDEGRAGAWQLSSLQVIWSWLPVPGCMLASSPDRKAEGRGPVTLEEVGSAAVASLRNLPDRA